MKDLTDKQYLFLLRFAFISLATTHITRMKWDDYTDDDLDKGDYVSNWNTLRRVIHHGHYTEDDTEILNRYGKLYPKYKKYVNSKNTIKVLHQMRNNARITPEYLYVLRQIETNLDSILDE